MSTHRPLMSGLFIALMVGASSVSAHASSHTVFSTEETAEIERIAREYIRNNPEIILEAIRQIEQRRRLAEAEQVQRQIALDREALVNDAGSPVGGNPDGDVTVVEFFDYRCPYCKAVAPRLAELLRKDAGIRFVYKEWPILGPVSVVGARAALAAWKQGKYVEFHDRLMGVSGQLSQPRVFEIASEIGLDLERMRKDMASDEVAGILKRNAELASRLKISGTPAFVIGDVLVPGAVSLEELESLVSEARSVTVKQR